MGALDLVLSEVETRFGISGVGAGSLMSGLLAFINQQSGGLGGLLDRFRSAGLGDSVSSWLRGDAKPISGELLENTLGHNTIDTIASKSGLSFSAASSALGFMIPKLVQQLAPRGSVPTRLPAEIMSYVKGPTAAVASGARQALHAAEGAASRTGMSRLVWPVLAILGVFLLGTWLWNRSGSAARSVFNAEEQVRLATQKASSALAALRPGFSAQDLAGALNLNIINFFSGSAQLPLDSYDFLNKTAIAFKSVPAGTVIEIDGHTDNTGDTASNLQLSQQRADAVRDYLVKQGVDPTVLATKGYGDTRPVASNDTEEGKFRNRRIEFSVVR